MKLISKYNRLSLPILTAIFFISAVVSYLLIKDVLLEELDEGIVKLRSKIDHYATAEKKLPEINLFTNESVTFQKVNSPINDSGISTIHQYNAVSKKNRSFRKLIFPVVVSGQLYKATIHSQVEGTKRLTKVIFAITIATIFMIILFSTILNKLIISKLWVPFYQSLAALKTFKIDNPLPIIFPKTNTNEFNFLIDSLKASTNAESETYRTLKEFTENASHEIQTPLAIIRSKLDILIQNENFSEKQSENGKTVYAAVDKLSRLSQSLLLITKIENRKFENKKKIDLQFKMAEKLRQFEELWQMNSIDVTNNLAPATIDANEDLIDILLNNLLSNATKHNIENGNINIELGNGNVLFIENDGINTPLDDQRIFKRFYKEAKHQESNGLGLSIIKQICDASLVQISYRFTGSKHRFMLSW